MQALHAPSVPSSTHRCLGRRAARLARQLLLPMLASAGHAFWQPALAADDFLEPDKAFQFSARPLDAKTVEVTFDIAPGYYLYRDQFRFAAKDAPRSGTPVIPPGKTKFDETFQKTVETYRNSVKISVPVESASGTFRFVTTSQGCADAGLCYPPQKAAAMVSLAGFGGTGSVQPAPAEDAGTNGSDLAATSASSTAAAALTTAAATTAVRPPTTAAARGDAGAIESVLRSGAFWPIVGAFFVAGLLLSLTPCVLPMLPIISSIIVGQGGYGGGAACWRSRHRHHVRCRAPAASRSPPRIPSAWPSSTRRSASLRGSPVKDCRPRCRTPGCWAPSRSAWSCCRCPCSASTSCSCPTRWSAASTPRRSGCPPAESPGSVRWAASRH